MAEDRTAFSSTWSEAEMKARMAQDLAAKDTISILRAPVAVRLLARPLPVASLSSAKKRP